MTYCSKYQGARDVIFENHYFHQGRPWNFVQNVWVHLILVFESPFSSRSTPRDRSLFVLTLLVKLQNLILNRLCNRFRSPASAAGKQIHGWAWSCEMIPMTSFDTCLTSNLNLSRGETKWHTALNISKYLRSQHFGRNHTYIRDATFGNQMTFLNNGFPLCREILNK